jgi:magnesium chelatase subunit I
MIINSESTTHLRISDLYGVIPAITGKIELVYEGEQEGPSKVAHILIGKAVRTMFEKHFPTPEKVKKSQDANPYQIIVNWFGKGNILDILNTIPDAEYEKLLIKVPGLKEIIKKHLPNENGKAQLLMMEFVLTGLLNIQC